MQTQSNSSVTWSKPIWLVFFHLISSLYLYFQGNVLQFLTIFLHSPGQFVHTPVSFHLVSYISLFLDNLTCASVFHLSHCKVHIQNYLPLKFVLTSSILLLSLKISITSSCFFFNPLDFKYLCISNFLCFMLITFE